MAAVAVVTDSTSDLDAGLRERFGIDVVPLFVNFGTASYRDTVELSRDDFYRTLAAEPELPTTTQPTPAMFADAFAPHVAAGRTVVCLTITSRLSGTINAATAAARTFPDGAVHVVDSETVTGGLALLAMRAAELAREGADASAVLAAVRAERERVCGFAALPDLSHAVRTGRISRAHAFIGSLIKIVPVLRIARGAIAVEAQVRTFGRARDVALAAALGVAGTGSARFCLMHARAPALAAALAERLRAERGADAWIEVIEAGPAIATHAGAGGIGVFVLPA